MSTYKTVPLHEYDQRFRDVAEELFRRVPAPSGGVQEKGSYSFRMSNYSEETMAKIVIYQRRLGVEMQGELPWRSDGVYLLVRTSEEFGGALWNELGLELSHFTRRMRRDDNVAIAPNYNERFAYFPIMAGEDTNEIAGFVTRLMECANRLGSRRAASIHSPQEL